MSIEGVQVNTRNRPRTSMSMKPIFPPNVCPRRHLREFNRVRRLPPASRSRTIRWMKKSSFATRSSNMSVKMKSPRRVKKWSSKSGAKNSVVVAPMNTTGKPIDWFERTSIKPVNPSEVMWSKKNTKKSINASKDTKVTMSSKKSFDVFRREQPTQQPLSRVIGRPFINTRRSSSLLCPSNRRRRRRPHPLPFNWFRPVAIVIGLRKKNTSQRSFAMLMWHAISNPPLVINASRPDRTRRRRPTIGFVRVRLRGREQWSRRITIASRVVARLRFKWPINENTNVKILSVKSIKWKSTRSTRLANVKNHPKMIFRIFTQRFEILLKVTLSHRMEHYLLNVIPIGAVD